MSIVRAVQDAPVLPATLTRSCVRQFSATRRSPGLLRMLCAQLEAVFRKLLRTWSPLHHLKGIRVGGGVAGLFAEDDLVLVTDGASL